ncbi:hypothetical protein FXN65_10480 [Metapseudomonas lalkuanensis]|uniref:Uncharacterized protein n=1 Tax=Metapseudomonas lalkuanensis TaxID=2604832 RepID=A0A5J6QPF3_9GAMM|nr:hypothetical protein FXN65_10480 [Pseudomonas lalkuanensis]
MLQDSPHAPTSPQGDNCMDAICHPLPRKDEHRSSRMLATSHNPASWIDLLFLAKWRSFLDQFLCFLRKTEN